MAWNEPGKGRDPWGGRRGNGAADLDELVRNLQRRLTGLFGGGSSGGNEGRLIALLLGTLIVSVWLLTGMYQLDDYERGIVQRFGRYVETTAPGLHWRWPWPIETVTKVDVAGVRKYEHKTVMLTADENIVSLEVEVQYRAIDPRAFVFNVRGPEETLGEVVNSAIREIVGKSAIDDVIETRRAEIAAQALTLTQNTLDFYEAGLAISTFNLKNVQLPDQVQDAVRDATKAREDKETSVLAAQAYANDILPKARGQAARDIQEAEAYKARVVAEAQGETSRFLKLLAEYRKAPGVTRDRLYLDAMEEVLGASAKVIVDTKQGGQMLYLPLDRLLESRRAGAPAAPSAPSDARSGAKAAEEDAGREPARERGGR
ncbi:MAG TPA: FtsH protease activity modulator HflK [Gammaproteobacteria bacterium]|nr:FtsH protease activity modulator HflK [Gammaproteobacteria bacterium]